MNAFFRATFTL